MSTAKAGMKIHTDKTFDRELSQLRQKLLAMGQKVEQQLADSMRALTERDTEVAERVAVADAPINRLEVEVDELCRKILALRQPAASDLRYITTALKIVTDLERCGDLAVNIAERVIDLNQAPPLARYQDLPRLAKLAEAQLQGALEAFVEGDVDKAARVLTGDEALDGLFLKIFNELIAYMMENAANIRRATALVFVAKHLERVGDHATNIAEMVIYMVRGTDVRHPRSRGFAPRRD